jgi:two-component system nitrogen regulation response regulator GlnG
MLARHQNNQLRAARALGINRNTLRKRLDTLGIEMDADRSNGAD